MTANNPQAFPCSRCGLKASHYQGHQWLCPKHYRFGQMKASARRHGKYVPSHEELQELVHAKMLCVDCKREMNWLSKDGQSTVTSLQHYRNGTIGLVCRSCNTRHAFMLEDSYKEMPKDSKHCPQCKLIKSSSLFSSDLGRTGQIRRKSWCKECSNKSHTNWQRRNKDEYNKKQREYRKKRKSEGNPITRKSP